MHDSVMIWVADQVTQHKLYAKRTLEVGSLDVNGSVRSLFSGEYVGVDMRDGPGVDMVASAHELPFDSESFDVVISTEMLEHDPAPWRSLPEMGRVLRPGGHLLITARGNGFGLHMEPYDLWRYMPDSTPILLRLAGCEPMTVATDPEVPGIFGHGVRS